MATKIDSRQIHNRSILDQLTNTTNTELDNLLVSLNSELTPLIRLLPNDSGADRVINFDASSVATSETGRTRQLRMIDGSFVSVSSGTITLPAASGSPIVNSGGDNITLTISNDSWIKCLVSVRKDGNIVLKTGVEGASEAAATLPDQVHNALAIGYISIQTVGSAVQNIVHSVLYQLTGADDAALVDKVRCVQYFELLKLLLSSVQLTCQELKLRL